MKKKEFSRKTFSEDSFTYMGTGSFGGKAEGLKLLYEIAKNSIFGKYPDFEVSIPKTIVITTSYFDEFMEQNNLYQVALSDNDDKRITHQFQKASLPPVNIGEKPIIVRGSSLLEDSLKTAFSGKYISLFLANTGNKEERLDSLKDAIAEVYASIFSQDPIEYRNEKGLLDFNEEMGILIQEVVGNKVGKYFFPSFAGVAFSENDFRLSSRISREDGLIRIVPGLGTRAVDRLANDYPILIAPGKPNLRVNVTPDEIVKYSPKYIDVINLETNTFETIEFAKLARESGKDIPLVKHIISIHSDGLIQMPGSIFNIDFTSNQLFVNFEGLFTKTDFIKQIKDTLELLQLKIGEPVDIEFAHDGKDLYLLQCRPQSYTHGNIPSPIPQDINPEKMIFSADKYVINGLVPDITHVVYIDPENYNSLDHLSDLKDVGIIVGKLNKILPKKQFILMGSGLWGSRGDIKLGVDVSYADINNTSVLIEIAQKKGNYTQDLSFGTHFIHDLIEASIKYLPLYPDSNDNIFNNLFFNRSTNLLLDLLPEYTHLESTVHVIDILDSWNGHILKILMNSEINKAIGYLCDPKNKHENDSIRKISFPAKTNILHLCRMISGNGAIIWQRQ